jgi:hypothetical protein
VHAIALGIGIGGGFEVVQHVQKRMSHKQIETHSVVEAGVVLQK